MLHGLRFGEEAGARNHMPYAFSGKVAAAGGEAYLVCAAVAVWILSSAIGYSFVCLCNAGMQIALQFFWGFGTGTEDPVLELQFLAPLRVKASMCKSSLCKKLLRVKASVCKGFCV